MSRQVTIIIQCLCMAFAMLSPLLPVPPQWREFMIAVPAVISAINAILAHSYNPDGTMAIVGYEKAQKLLIVPAKKE